MNQSIHVVDGARTPFLKARNRPGPFAASDLAVQAGRELLLRQRFAPTDLDEVILGCASPSPDEVNIGRVVALRMGCGKKVPGWTVMRNCASGMQALDSAIANIRGGRAGLVRAGGVDATAENLAFRFGITRREMDEFSAKSHQRVLAAQKDGHFTGEIAPLFDGEGNLYEKDDGVREDSTPANLAKLKPFFDRKYGNVTAGNSSQITDGAAWLVLASDTAVAKYQLPVLGTIVDSEWAGLDPAQMGLGPVHAATPLLKRHGLKLDDIDAWEINEAFAAQVIACLRAWADDAYCRAELGQDGALGKVDEAKLNVDGGAIALGHPVGASGARIVLHLLNVLKRTKAKRGIAAICIGGGLGGAMLVEAA